MRDHCNRGIWGVIGLVVFCFVIVPAIAAIGVGTAFWVVVAAAAVVGLYAAGRRVGL